MDKDNKRAQRRKDEQTIWLRRLNREFNNGKMYFDRTCSQKCRESLKTAEIPEDLKNSKYGMLLKNTANPQTYKNVGKHLDNKHEQKIERREAKKIIDEEIINYNNMKDKQNCIEDYRYELKRINEQIEMIEQMLNELPERLKGLLDEKRKLEMEICYLQR
jgi:hypothetical protein